MLHIVNTNTCQFKMDDILFTVDASADILLPLLNAMLYSLENNSPFCIKLENLKQSLLLIADGGSLHLIVDGMHHQRKCKRKELFTELLADIASDRARFLYFGACCSLHPQALSKRERQVTEKLFRIQALL